MEMRQVFVGEMRKLMQEDENVIMLDADLGKASGTFALQKDFKDRAIECGIAEQNMASIAAGLSSYGFKPYIHSFTPFVTRRICDQIAISMAYSQQNVKIVGTDPGISAELNGGTHMSVEDIGVLRSIPNIVIFEPVDCVQLKKALPVIDKYNGVVYIRLFRKELPEIFTEDYNFDLFKADILAEGKDITLVCSGIMVDLSLKAKEILKAEGISVEVINVHTIKPIDKETLIKSCQKTKGCVIAENHNIIGGLGSAVLESLEELPIVCKRIGIKDRFGEVGKMSYLKDILGMNVEDIVNSIKEVIKNK